MNQTILPSLNGLTVWLFCRVIDNFGDAGVAWRLAKILHEETGCTVRLFIDDLATLAALNPNIDPDIPEQSVIGIQVLRWVDEEPTSIFSGSLQTVGMPGFQKTFVAAAPTCVIEMFACELPLSVRKIVRECGALWLNWEYLTAEDWAENMHLLPSPQADGTQKYFYFMGFSERSGGLLRERDIHYPVCRQDQDTLSAYKLYLFGYTSPVWADWLNCWQSLDRAFDISLAGGQVQAALEKADIRPSANLSMRSVPFVPQNEFDAQLAAADMNIVRGEESFVRAQLLAKPFFWQIYPQKNHAHLDKLHAFWEKVYAYFPPHLAQAHAALSDELNGAAVLSAADRCHYWQVLLSDMKKWQHALCSWRQILLAQASAIEKLASLICEKRLK